MHTIQGRPDRGAWSRSVNRLSRRSEIPVEICTKVVWTARPRTCTLQPLRRKKTVQEIRRICFNLRDHFAAPLIGLIVFARKISFDAGPKSKRCSSPLALSPPRNKNSRLRAATSLNAAKGIYFPKEGPSFGR